MKTADVIRRAGRNLRQAKGRTVLTALAISVGAFTITVALAAGAGGRAYIDSLVSTSGDTESLQVFPRVEVPDETVTSDGPEEYITDGTAPVGGSSAMMKPLTDVDVKRIEAMADVESATPMISVDAAYMYGPNEKKFMTALAVKLDKTSLEYAAGSLPNNRPSIGSVSIPETYVKSLGFTDAADAIGKTVTLHIVPKPTTEDPMPETGKDFTYTIQAVDKAGADSLMYMTAISLSAEDAQEIYKYQAPEGAMNEYYGLTAQVVAGGNVAEVQEKIKNAGYDVFSLQDLREAMFTAVDVAMAGLAGFGGLAILASIFGVINTMYISVLERTQQIGLMKALGMRSRDVGRLFRFEAAWIGFLGGVIGAGLAILLGLLANPFIDTALNLGGRSLLVFEPVSVAIVIISLILVAVISGIFPSRKAAKLDPIEALRTE